jgi:hypothetical protein
MTVGGLALVARSSRRGRGVLVLALVVAVVLAGVAVFRLLLSQVRGGGVLLS